MTAPAPAPAGAGSIDSPPDSPPKIAPLIRLVQSSALDNGDRARLRRATDPWEVLQVPAVAAFLHGQNLRDADLPDWLDTARIAALLEVWSPRHPAEVLKRDLDYSEKRFARFMASAGPQRRELAIVIAKALRQRQLTCNPIRFFHLFREPEDRDPPRERIAWMLKFHGSATPARRDQA